MYESNFLGLDWLFWQTLAILGVSIIALVLIFKGSSNGTRVFAGLAFMVLFAPLVWVNWWVTSGDSGPDPDAGSSISSYAHYASLGVIVVLLVLFLAALAFWAKRRKANVNA